MRGDRLQSQDDANTWGTRLCSTLLQEFAAIEQGDFYSVISGYPGEVQDLEAESISCVWGGYPTLWALFGHVGAQAFAIGIMTDEPLGESTSYDIDATPPGLAQRLMKVGHIFTYSQVAILIVPEALLDDNRKEWIRGWVSVRSPIRRICKTRSGYDADDVLARRLTAEVLAPWHGIANARAVVDTHTDADGEETEVEQL